MGLGFKGNKNSKKSNSQFDEELDDLNIDFDDLDDDDDFEDTSAKAKPIQSKRAKNKINESKIKQETSVDKKKKVLIVIVSVVVVILFVIVGFLVFGGNSSDKAEASASLQTTKQSQDAKPKEDDTKKQQKDYPTDVNAGVPDIEMGTNMKQNSDTTDPKEFLKDINGNKIDKNYDVVRIEHATDFIDYTKKRGVTGDGVELLWLDATYKGRHYEVQVPFEVFKELDSSGITVVDVEILHTRDGGTVVSYMNVRKDYKQLLKNKEQQ